jgi:glycerophosphoryl diester phosphodiesterase
METRISQAPPIYTVNKKRKFNFKRLGIIVILLLLGYLALFLLVVPERPSKPFFNGDSTFVIAHRGGAELAPENTLVAFEKAQSLGVDVIEFDVRMTKDGHLVVIHDETVNRTTNGEGVVDEITLTELKQLDAAHTFQDIRGRYIYRGQGVEMPTVEEVFSQFGDMRFNIEIKEAPQNKTYPDIELKLWELIQKFNMEDNVLISSFSDATIRKFNEHAHGSVAISASKQEAQRFVFYHKLFLNRLYRPSADALQLPNELGIVGLSNDRLIKGAKKLNMHIQYWTINKEQEMRKLIDKGVGGIITDRPDLLIRVIHEMEDVNEKN